MSLAFMSASAVFIDTRRVLRRLREEGILVIGVRKPRALLVYLDGASGLSVAVDLLACRALGRIRRRSSRRGKRDCARSEAEKLVEAVRSARRLRGGLR